MPATELHAIHRVGWLRAAVLGANDGIVSTASLLMGVAATGADSQAIAITGVASLVAGAMSMAAGEYVSVSSQADTEQADLELEKTALANHPTQEHEELAAIYVQRGLDANLANQVATQLMTHNALAAHARDELGIAEHPTARPVQAAITSAATFASGAFLPLLMVWLLPSTQLLSGLAVSTLLFLGLLGAVSAKVGGAPVMKAVGRVIFWGALAMGLTAAVGAAFGVATA